MPELERYVLALLAKLDGTLKQAVDDFDFNSYTRALTDFCNEDLSAFFFDIRKDSLYCDAATNPKRMAYRTVLDTLFHALVRYAAPVLVFTAEEVWGTRFPDGGSVHLLEWPTLPGTTPSRHPGAGRDPSLPTDGGVDSEMGPDLRQGDELVEKWDRLRELRSEVTEVIEPHRQNKSLGSSLQAEVLILTDDDLEIQTQDIDLSELFITSHVHLLSIEDFKTRQGQNAYIRFPESGDCVGASRTTHHKCGRCWRHLPDVTSDGALCSRCDNVVGAMEAAL